MAHGEARILGDHAESRGATMEAPPGSRSAGAWPAWRPGKEPTRSRKSSAATGCACSGKPGTRERPVPARAFIGWRGTNLARPRVDPLNRSVPRYVEPSRKPALARPRCPSRKGRRARKTCPLPPPIPSVAEMRTRISRSSVRTVPIPAAPTYCSTISEAPPGRRPPRSRSGFHQRHPPSGDIAETRGGHAATPRRAMADREWAAGLIRQREAGLRR